MKYGALCKIEPQCNEAGYTLGEKAELMEQLHFSLNLLHIHSVITDSEWSKGIERLNKMIGKYAKPLEHHTNK